MDHPNQQQPVQSFVNKPSTPAIPPSQTAPSQPPSQLPNSTRQPLLLLIMFIVGIFGGMLLFATYPKIMSKDESANNLLRQPEEITLPKDAAKIQDCVDYKGTLYAKPQDLPHGPIYMVYQNKVIGLEYEIDQKEFTQGKIYKDLSTLNSAVNHMTVDYLREGHSGLPSPHSHIDLYLIDTQTETKIICEKNAIPAIEASPSSKLTEPASTIQQSTPSPTLFITTAPSPPTY